jgi:hypothetical protein
VEESVDKGIQKPRDEENNKGDDAGNDLASDTPGTKTDLRLGYQATDARA